MRELPRIFTHRLTALFRRRHLECDLDDELRSHLDMAVDRNLKKGMSPEDAAARLCAASVASSKPRSFTATRGDCLCSRQPCKTCGSACGCSGEVQAFLCWPSFA